MCKVSARDHGAEHTALDVNMISLNLRIVAVRFDENRSRAYTVIQFTV